MLDIFGHGFQNSQLLKTCKDLMHIGFYLSSCNSFLSQMANDLHVPRFTQHLFCVQHLLTKCYKTKTSPSSPFSVNSIDKGSNLLIKTFLFHFYNLLHWICIVLGQSLLNQAVAWQVLVVASGQWPSGGWCSPCGLPIYSWVASLWFQCIFACSFDLLKVSRTGLGRVSPTGTPQ